MQRAVKTFVIFGFFFRGLALDMMVKDMIIWDVYI